MCERKSSDAVISRRYLFFLVILTTVLVSIELEKLRDRVGALEFPTQPESNHADPHSRSDD